MTTYAINMSNVGEVAAEMGAIAQCIWDILERLDDSTAQNLAGWTSSARDAYTTAKQIWHQKAADMVLQATNAQGTLSSITDNYALAEYQGLGLWGR